MMYFAKFTPFLIPILAWSLYWKGKALWASARKGEKNWFVALLLINTMGLLEIFYLYYISEHKK